jgi:dolichol-phosphate mannosyltransferase
MKVMQELQTRDNYAREEKMTIDHQDSGSGCYSHPASSTLLLSIVIPTFNEKANIQELVKRTSEALIGIAWEIVFVDDDSPDGTADFVRSLALRDPRLRCIQRIGRRGLSSACVEGILATSAPLIAVMDGDLQHDEKILPLMISRLRDEHFDVVVGSRYVTGGSIGEWQSDRAAMSRFATRLSRIVTPADLKDPMSGYFMITRPSFMGCVRNLSKIGFKILLDILASTSQQLKFCEIAYQFKPREAGESKLDSTAIWDFVMLLLDKSVGHIIPVRFLAFSVIGGFGVAVHMLVLTMLLKGLNFNFEFSQTGAAIVAMTSNFFLNNLLTYRDRRLSGFGVIKGLLSFYALCGLGAIANVGFAGYFFQQSYSWWLSGVAGILIGSVWNYAATSALTWRA